MPHDKSWETLNLDRVTTGKDGRLYLRYGRTGMFPFAMATDWRCQVEVVATDFQSAYNSIVGEIPTGFRVTMTVSEAVVTDHRLLGPVLAGIRDNGKLITVEFVAYLDSGRENGQNGIYVVSNLRPTGSFDIFNIAQSAINTRDWTFRGSSLPRIDAELFSG